MNNKTPTHHHLLQSLAVVALLTLGTLSNPASARIFVSIGIAPIRFVATTPAPVVVVPRPRWRCHRGWRGRRVCRWR